MPSYALIALWVIGLLVPGLTLGQDKTPHGVVTPLAAPLPGTCEGDPPDPVSPCQVYRCINGLWRSGWRGTGTSCDDGNPCTYDTTCNASHLCVGSTANCPASECKVCNGTSTCAAADSQTVCRASAGLCDVAETCSGTTQSCPEDQVVEPGTTCRLAAGACDVSERCDGVSAACPTNEYVAAGTVCKASTNLCDQPMSCSGSSPSCPQPLPKPEGTVCRAAAGPCDEEEVCNGVNMTCPADHLKAADTVCRPAAGECDQAETCDGLSAGCPPSDGKVAAGTTCRAAAGLCDLVERCDGSSDTCPPDALAPAETVCQPAAGDCDLAETCDGVGAACPDNARRPVTWVCRPASGPCDAAEKCTGTDHCPEDGRIQAGTVCRESVGGCDVAESCDGGLATCPPDGYALGCDEGPRDIRFAYDAAGHLTGVIDVMHDPANCGALAHACPSPAAGQVACSNGKCGAVGNGLFYDTQTNPLNCGGVGIQCPVPGHGLSTCSEGTCGFECDPTYARAGSACVDLLTDVSNCGYVGNVCQDGDLGSAMCWQGTCAITAVPVVYSVNGVAPSGLVFKASMWDGIRIEGAGLEAVTYVELEDWGSDTVDGVPDGPQSLPMDSGFMPLPSTGSIHFTRSAASIHIPQVALRQLWLTGSVPAFSWRRWYKVRLHYVDLGMDLPMTVDVAISLDEYGENNQPAPAIVSASQLRSFRTQGIAQPGYGRAAYSPASGFIWLHDPNAEADVQGTDPTTLVPAPVAVLSYRDALQTEYPIISITHEGVYIQAGLDPELLIDQPCNVFQDVILVFPAEAAPTAPVLATTGGTGAREDCRPLQPGGVILRGSAFLEDGLVRVSNPPGTPISASLEGAVFADQKVVIRSFAEVQDAAGYLEYTSPRGATALEVAFLKEPTITSIGEHDYIVYDSVLTATGYFLDTVSDVAFDGDALETLTRSTGPSPNAGEFHVVDDRTMLLKVGASGGLTSRGLWATCACDGLYVEPFPGERLFHVVSAAGSTTFALAALDPTGAPPPPPPLQCTPYSCTMNAGPAGGSSGLQAPRVDTGAGGGGPVIRPRPSTCDPTNSICP